MVTFISGLGSLSVTIERSMIRGITVLLLSSLAPGPAKAASEPRAEAGGLYILLSAERAE
jgi:hypothetical protein